METYIHRLHDGRSIFGLRSLICVITSIVCLFPATGGAQMRGRRGFDEKVIIESGPAAKVDGKVRAAFPGTMMELYVKVGDEVKKGQVLGHTELAATKYQLDLALFAMQHNASVKATAGQAAAWTATREETEEAVRKHKMEKSRLEWASGMEKFYRGAYEAQVEQTEVERINYEYWQSQYEGRFFRAPMDGVVSQVLVDIGKQVSYGTHAFTIENEDLYVIPVSVPAALAENVTVKGKLPIRSSANGQVMNGTVESIEDDPSAPANKKVRLLVSEKDTLSGDHPNLTGTKFDVLLPQTGGKTPANSRTIHPAG